jgi:cephalosporin hydroxylase
MSAFEALGKKWLLAGFDQNFSYNWKWMGVPFVQLPADVLRLQQIIFETQPDLIIETGTKQGGSAVFFASMLQLMGRQLAHTRVITIDKEKKRLMLAGHPMGEHIKFIYGNSGSPEVLDTVKQYISGRRIMVFLDSSHKAVHVTRELNRFGPMVSKGCYLVVADGICEDIPEWNNRGVNPAIAARQFLQKNPNFKEQKLDDHHFVTHFKNGYLKRVK